jgi:recombination protein RecR
MGAPAVFQQLVEALGRLPGVGRRTAERMATRVIQDRSLLDSLVAALSSAGDRMGCCSLCGSLSLKEQNPCMLCTGHGRDGHTICVVEEAGDIPLIERSGYRGRYHALMGKWLPGRVQSLPGQRVKALVDRVDREGVKEVILALSTDMEADMAANVIVEMMKGRGVKVTRLASGLPVMSGVAYSDPVTLGRALAGRQPMQAGERPDG